MQALRVEGRAPRIIVVENVPGLLTSHERAMGHFLGRARAAFYGLLRGCKSIL